MSGKQFSTEVMACGPGGSQGDGETGMGGGENWKVNVTVAVSGIYCGWELRSSDVHEDSDLV